MASAGVQSIFHLNTVTPYDLNLSMLFIKWPRGHILLHTDLETEGASNDLASQLQMRSCSPLWAMALLRLRRACVHLNGINYIVFGTFVRR